MHFIVLDEKVCFSLIFLLLASLHWKSTFEISFFSIAGILNFISDISASNIDNSICVLPYINSDYFNWFIFNFNGEFYFSHWFFLENHTDLSSEGENLYIRFSLGHTVTDSKTR